MRQVSVQPDNPHPKTLAEAVRVLERGGLVAFPTETVYGLCVDAGNEEAVARLYALKAREREKACAYLLPDRARLTEYTDELPPIACRLADRFWPGPLTLVVPDRHGGTVGLRLPSTVLARSLAMAIGRSLLQTSANRTGQPAALNAEGVKETFQDDVDLILDGGRTPGDRSSTVVECTEQGYRILRAGAIADEEIVSAATELVLLVCTGNLCRSPLAEAALRRATAERLECGVEEVVTRGFRFGSFGTMALENMPATENAIQSAADIGLDISAHRSRPFSIGLLEEASRIYCLAQGHREFLLPYFKGRSADLELLDPNKKDIRDPYRRSPRFYRKVAEQIVKACAERAGELSSGDSRTMAS